MVTGRYRAFVLVVWCLSTIAGGAIVIELFLHARAIFTEHLRDAAIRERGTPLEMLRLAYRPFTIQHLDPQYFFFFPREREQRLALRNEVCSIDADGFREPGPSSTNGRKLAVLLGGSAAFGHYASSNDTTITSYLNRMQQQYYFVNAGVPSWNSMQELMRMSAQIVDLRPALVMTYDGANDASLIDAGLEADGHLKYPAGTAENFDQLETLVDEARRPWTRFRLARLFPEIANRIEKYGPHAPEPDGPIDPALVKAAAHRYVTNLSNIAAMADRIGAHYVAVFQAIAPLHKNIQSGVFGARDAADDAAFRDAALAERRSSLDLRDFSTVLDADLATIPVAGDDLSAGTIFIDAVHLTDRGNELIARHLLGLLPQ